MEYVIFGATKIKNTTKTYLRCLNVQDKCNSLLAAFLVVRKRRKEKSGIEIGNYFNVFGPEIVKLPISNNEENSFEPLIKLQLYLR